MKKSGFTIVELVIAIAIFSLIIVYMYKATAMTKKANDVYERNYNVVSKNEELKRVLYNDIFNQVDPYKDIFFDSKEEVFYLRSKNSLHNFANPYIIYYVHDKQIIRLESLKKIKLPLKNEDKENAVYENDAFLEKIEEFKVHTHKNSYVFLWIQEKKRTLFEIKLPYHRKVIVVKSDDSNTSKQK